VKKVKNDIQTIGRGGGLATGCHLGSGRTRERLLGKKRGEGDTFKSPDPPPVKEKGVRQGVSNRDGVLGGQKLQEDCKGEGRAASKEGRKNEGL